ncbi:hypothetical protein Tco_0155779 [Tanacetum coccineum]
MYSWLDEEERAGDHYENGLFSSSLSDLFTRKLRLSAANNNGMYAHSVGASQYQQEEKPFQSLKEIEAQTIGSLLPDDESRMVLTVRYNQAAMMPKNWTF